jgi:acetyl esterase/lipase
MNEPMTLPLWNDRKSTGIKDNDDFQPYLEVYTLDTAKPLGAVIVCPGGGYSGRAAHEGGIIAQTYNKLGFHAFVLQYRVAPYTHPAPLEDAARAVRLVRHNAAQWNVAADKIAILGFSAGGHLAGSLGVHYPDVAEDIEFPALSCRPDALILCYAVINGHEGSYQNLFAGNINDDTRKYFHLNAFVDANTPPAFLWHTVEDGAVPVENALDFSKAMRASGVPFELHVFPFGNHGLGLGIGSEFEEISVWPELSATWLAKMGWK